MHRSFKAFVSMVAVALGLTLPHTTRATTYYWDASVSTTWGTAGNWSLTAGVDDGATATPIATDDVVFNALAGAAAQTVLMGATTSINSVTLNYGGSTNIQGTGGNRNFTLGAGGITSNVGAGAFTVGSTTANQNIFAIIGASQTWQNDSSSQIRMVNATTNGAGLVNTLTLAGVGSGTFLFSNSLNEGVGGTLSLVVNMTGSGSVSLSSTGSYSGGTTVKAGTLIVGGTGGLGTGAALIGDTSDSSNVTLTLNASGTFANNLTVQAGSSGTARITTGSSAPIIGGTLTLNKDTIFDNGSGSISVTNTILGSGNITLGTGGTLVLGTGGTTGGLQSATTVAGSGNLGFNRSDNVVLANNLSGAVGITQLGTGTLTLSGVTGGIHTGTGPTRVSNGTLALNFTNAISPTNLIAATSVLTLGTTATGGNLVLIGASGTTNTQTFASTTLTANSENTITLTAGGSGGTLSLALGAVTRNAGAYVNLATNAGASITSTTGTANSIWLSSGGIVIGTYGNDWAARAAAGTEVVAGSTLGGFYTNSDSTTLTGNADIASTVDTTLAAPATITSIRFNQNEGRTVDLNGNTLTLSSGGLMIGSNVATAGSKIIGGTLRGSTGSSRELVVVQNSSQAFEIGAVITDSVGSTAFSKHGAGTLILSNNNTWAGQTYINAGTLQIGSGGTTGMLGSTANVINLGVLAINRSDAATIGNVISGSGQVQVLGGGTTTFTVANTYTGGLIVKNGTAQGQISATAFSTGAITLGDSAGGSNNASLIQTTTGLTIANPIVLAANTTGTLTVGNTSAGIAATTFSGAVTGANSLTVANQGAGAFALTLSGNINNAGALNILGTSTGLTTLSGGVGSNVTAVTHTGANGLTMSTGPLANNGALTFSGTGAGAVSVSSAVNTVGAILNNGTTTGTTAISGAIGAGVTSITQNSTSSALQLSGANSNFAGPINLTAGALRLHSATALGGNGSASGTGGALTIAGGTNLENSSGAAIILTTVNALNLNGSFTYNSTNSLTFSGPVTLGAANIGISSNGAGGFNTSGAVNGTTNLTFSAGANGGYSFSGSGNFAGSITNNGTGTGALTFSGGLTSNVTTISHTSGGNLTLSGAAGVANNGDILFAGTGAGTVTFSAANINTNGTITNSGSTTGTTTISGLMGATVAGVTQNSSTSQLTLSGNQTNFSGGLTIKAGTVHLAGSNGSNNPLGTAQVILGDTSGSANATITNDQTGNIATALLVQNGTSGTLSLRNLNTSGNPNYNGAITMNNNLTIEVGLGQNAIYTIGGGLTTTVGSGYVLTLKNGSSSATSNILIATGGVNFAGSILNAGTGTRTATISAAIGANVTGITQNSATSLLTISGTNTNFAGDVSILAGTLRASATGALNANNTVAVSNGAIFEVMPSSAQTLNIEGLTGAGSVNMVTGASRTLAAAGASGSYEFSGVISNALNTFSFTKTGGSTQILSGTNTYNGATTISGGLLQVNGTHNGAAAYAVNNGGTLGGNGTINTTTTSGVTVAAGGKLAPGASPGTLTMNLGASGVLNITGAVTANNSQSMLFELDTVGGSDKLAVTNSGATSAVNIGTGVLEFNDFVFSATNNVIYDTTYTLIDSNAPITGTLGANLTGILTPHYSGTLSFGDGGNDLVLTVTPEPGSIAVLALGALGLLRRRRRAAQGWQDGLTTN